MSAHGFTPEVAELLSEALRDPKSGLLRLPKLGRKCLPSEEPIRPVQLEKSLDRYLVERHREEVGKLLYLASRDVLTSHPAEEHQIHVIPGAPSMGARRRSMAKLEEASGDSDALSLLDAFHDSTESSRTDAYTLARAAHAVHPRGIARYHIALCHRSAGRYSEATHLLESLTSSSESPPTRFYALSLQADIHYRQGQIAEARSCYRDSVTSGDSEPFASFYWLNASLLLCDEADAVLAASSLERFAGGASEQGAEALALIKLSLAGGEIVPSTGCTRLAKKLTDKLPRETAEIADALVKLY